MRPVILYSGGIDSLVLTTDIIRNPFRYGYDNSPSPVLVHFTALDSVHSYCTTLVRKKQLPYLRSIQYPEFAPVELKVIDADPLIFTEAPTEPQPEIVLWDYRSAAQGMTPARNLIFLSIAFNYAASIQSDHVYAAFQMGRDRWARLENDSAMETSDDNPLFIKAFNALAEVGGILPTQRLIAPFIDARMSKAGIILLGLSHSVPFDKTYSCVWSAPTPCGACAACTAYARACAELGKDVRRGDK